MRAHVTSGACSTDPTCGSGWGAGSAAGSAACGDPHPDSWRRGPPARLERCRSRPVGHDGDARERRALPQGHGRRRTEILSRRCPERGRPGSAPSSRGAGGGRGRGVPLWPRAQPAAVGSSPSAGSLRVSRRDWAAVGIAAWPAGRALCRRRGCGRGAGALGRGHPEAFPRSLPGGAGRVLREGRKRLRADRTPWKG